MIASIVVRSMLLKELIISILRIVLSILGGNGNGYSDINGWENRFRPSQIREYGEEKEENEFYT